MSEDCFMGKLYKGDRRALGKAITLVESTDFSDMEKATCLLKNLEKHSNTMRVSISGPPGAGKSSLIEVLGLRLIEKGYRVAVLAIDPSSPLGKGSILADKTRMEKLSRHPQAFVRPAASSAGFLGGVHPATSSVISVLEAAGFDAILIETIGVGQNEIAAAHLSDLMVLVLSPGAGDYLQGLKKGILEAADCVVINKADGDLKTLAEIMASDYQQNNVPVLCCSAYTEFGVDALLTCLLDKIKTLKKDGTFQKRRENQKIKAFEQAVLHQLQQLLFMNPVVKKQYKYLQKKIIEETLSSSEAAKILIDIFSIKDHPKEEC